MTGAIENGEYVAEFYENRAARPPVFHYVISKKGSAEILALGQALSHESVMEEARRSLVQLSGEKEAPPAPKPRKIHIVG